MIYFNLITIVLLYIIVASVSLYTIFGGFLYGAMWMKLPKQRVQKMLELGKVTQGTIVYDLGAGFGNVAFQAHKLGARVVAIEADPIKAWWIKRQIQKNHLINISCIQGNLLEENLAQADVLLCYLSDTLMKKIAEKTLKKTVIVVSACHKIKGYTPKIIDKNGIYPIYVYSD
jgi:predicted RNA methylase